MLEYVIVWWDVVRIIHATRYIRQVTSFSSIALLLPCTSRRFFSYSHPLSPPSRSPCLPHPLISRSPSWPRFLLSLAAFATSISYTPLPPSTPSNSPSHHDIYRSLRNAESYSVSLDSLKQVLMSCTPIPRSSPTTYPLATEHSSETLVLPSMSHSLAGLSSYLCISLTLFLPLSLSLFPIYFLSHFSLSFRLLQRTVKFAITADTLLMPNWS